ncbi:MAG: hypothetical protein JRE19_17195, partial [Deltaproteobacteria bacterium]|nr:hypothetical protein [Deltaproteobacteria bacterium]
MQGVTAPVDGFPFHDGIGQSGRGDHLFLTNAQKPPDFEHGQTSRVVPLEIGHEAGGFFILPSGSQGSPASRGDPAGAGAGGGLPGRVEVAQRQG